MLKTQKSKLVKVPWHDKTVFISGLTEKQMKDEIGFQIYTAEFLKKQNEFGWYHGANEYRGSGVQGLQAGIRAKRSGQGKGWPDWICPHRKLAIELKLPNSEVRLEQIEWLDYFNGIGWTAKVVYSFKEFEALATQKTS
jgi:hypothetical protein